MSSHGTLRTSLNQKTNAGIDNKNNKSILRFKLDYLVGRATSIDNREPKSSYFSRTEFQVKNQDLTFDLLKKVDQRKENIYLKTEFSTPTNNHQKEEKKKQLVALLNCGNINGKHLRTRSNLTQNKILRSLEVMKLKLDSNNHLVKR